jgi:ribosomal protein L19
MFEIGERYEIVTIEEGEEGHSVYTVKDVDLPLLKVVDGVGHEYIFNTHSPSFVSANRSDPNYVRKPSIYETPPPPPRAIGEDGWPKDS